MDDLRKRIEEMAQDDTVERWVNVPPGASRFLSRVHTLAEVVETTCENGTMAIQFRASRRNADHLMQLLGEERP
jgi:50S ribosomal subunit-associated GTPase HflX